MCWNATWSPWRTASATRDVALRPHAKTHKCLEIARRQVALGAVGLTVATVGEAEVFADAGFSDLFIAYPVWAAGARGRRLRALAERVALRVGADSSEGVELLARALVGTPAEVVIEVDSGHHRTGVEPERAGEIAVVAQRLGLPVAGVFTFPGHSYGPGQVRPAAADEGGRPAAGGGGAASGRGGRGPAQRRIDPDRRPGGAGGTERDPTRRVRLQRRPAGRTRVGRLGLRRPDRGRHRGQPARIERRPGRRQQGLGGRSTGVGHRERSSA